MCRYDFPRETISKCLCVLVNAEINMGGVPGKQSDTKITDRRKKGPLRGQK